MLDFTETSIAKISVHQVGNSGANEDLILSENIIEPDEDLSDLLTAYLQKPFKGDSFYRFKDMQDDVAALSNQFFDNPDDLKSISQEAAKYLYEITTNEEFLGGELWVVHYQNIAFEDEVCDAIGIYKSENKTGFLKINFKDEQAELDIQKGIHLSKPDKAALVMNTEAENGFLISVFENKSKESDRYYWRDLFLKVSVRNDSFYQTRNQLDVCRNFVKEVYNEKNNVEKTAQADFINKSLDYFQENESFDADSFENTVIEEPEAINTFREYKEQYRDEKNVEFEDQFDIQENVVKNSKKFFKSILKLDKNFHVYIHGKKDLIEKGYDNGKGMNYYKLYFTEEK